MGELGPGELGELGPALNGAKIRKLLCNQLVIKVFLYNTNRTSLIPILDALQLSPE